MDGLGQTALMYAAAKGHVLIVQTLLNHGADVNAADEVCLSGLDDIVTVVISYFMVVG
jgi:ankyrin repeat protein